LTPKEFALLEYRLRHAGKDVARTMIIENVWNLSFDTMTNVVEVYINYLRKKIDLGADIKLIQTVRGVGYQVRAPGRSQSSLIKAGLSERLFPGVSCRRIRNCDILAERTYDRGDRNGG